MEKTHGGHLWDSKEKCICLISRIHNCYSAYYIKYNSDEGREVVNLLQNFVKMHYFNPNIDVINTLKFGCIFQCKMRTFIQIFEEHSVWDYIRYDLNLPCENSLYILEEYGVSSEGVFEIVLNDRRPTFEIDLDKSLDIYKEFLKQNTPDKYAIDIYYIKNTLLYMCENTEKQTVLKMLQEALKTTKIISIIDRFKNKETFGSMWCRIAFEIVYFKELSLKYNFFKSITTIDDEMKYIFIDVELPLGKDENIISDKEKTMENNQILNNFNTDSDTIFEKEMPTANEKDEVIYNTSLDEALCKKIETIEIEVKRLDETKRSDRIYTINSNNKQKLDVIYALSEAFKYNFCKNEREKVFIMSYKQFLTDFKKCDGFNSMCDCLRLIRDFDETRDSICIKVVKELGRVVGETNVDNSTFVMQGLSLSDLECAEVIFKDVKAIKQRLNKQLHTILGKSIKLNAKEYDLYEKHFELQEENDRDLEYCNLVEMYDNLQRKYDNLLSECIAYKEAYKELEDLIYADDNALIEN